jgi:hypothetical protein
VPSDAYITQGCWFGGLVLVLGSIATATHQTITLHRFGTQKDNLETLRKLLTSRTRRKAQGGNQGTVRASRLAIFVWQVPVMMLRLGVYLFLIGLLVLLWDISGVNRDYYSAPNLKVRIIQSDLHDLVFFFWPSSSLSNWVLPTRIY